MPHFHRFFSDVCTSIMEKNNNSIFNLRIDFTKDVIDEKKLSSNPIIQFNKWMDQALNAQANEPNAMTLSTANKNGRVDGRIVLLRAADKSGFSFFTNYHSAKGKEIKSNKNVCLTFFWPELQRQVRIRGTVAKLAEKKSDLYFASRPRESQIGAHASHQSEVLAGREELENRYKLLEQNFSEKKIPRPKHWGGYLVNAIEIEFWQGRENRLHDRFLYSKNKSGKWKMVRLNP